MNNKYYKCHCLPGILCRADLANLVNEAALLAGRQTKLLVERIDFIQAVERSIAVSLSLCARNLFLQVFYGFFSILFSICTK